MNQLHERWSALPRVLRWGLLAAAVAIAWTVLDRTTWQLARDAGQEADLLQTELAKAAARPTVSRDVREVVLAHGEVRLPPGEAEGAQSLADAVNAILAAQSKVTRWSYDARGAARMQGGALRGVIDPGLRAARVSGELEFDAPPEVAAAVVATMEASPAIDAIPRLVMTRYENTRLVRVQMTVEAWVAARDSRDQRRRGA